MKGKDMFSIGAIFGAFAVIIGAIGSHYLKDKMHDFELVQFEKASFYHFIHSLAILVTGYFLRRSAKNFWLKMAGFSFMIGIILFCFPLYGYGIVHRENDGIFLNVIPIGGISLIWGWISLAVGSYKSH